MVFEKVKEIIVDTISCAEDQVKLEANLKRTWELILWMQQN